MKLSGSAPPRTTGRIGLFCADGYPLPDYIARAAYDGSEVDLDICHLSVRDMILSLCSRSVVRMTREFDLERNVWITDPYDECGRYADDILSDWRAFGAGSLESLHDTASAYVRKILACPKPHRVFHQDDFTFILGQGTVPKSLDMSRRPPAYRRGEGHSLSPDGICHPLLEHMAFCVPDGLVPHSRSGCSIMPSGKKLAPTPMPPARLARSAQKDIDILLMARRLDSDAAYVLEGYGRHDLLLCGAIDTASAFRQADQIQLKHGTPLGCMVLSPNDTTLCDTNGNDAKNIVFHGTCLAGSLEASEPVKPPRPASVTDDQIMVNLDRHGFTLIAPVKPRPVSEIRPEYVIAASYFTNEPRWYISAAAVLMCRPDLNWGLLLYLARTYGFAGSIRGILEELAECGHALPYPLSALRNYDAVCPNTDISETLRVYHAILAM